MVHRSFEQAISITKRVVKHIHNILFMTRVNNSRLHTLRPKPEQATLAHMAE
jgi:hypothetical protein